MKRRMVPAVADQNEMDRRLIARGGRTALAALKNRNGGGFLRVKPRTDIPPAPPVAWAPFSRRPYLVVVNAGPSCVLEASHLGDDCDLGIIQWSKNASPWVRRTTADILTSAAAPAVYLWEERNPTHRKFMSAAGMFGGKPPPYKAVVLIDDDVTPVGCTWSDVMRVGLELGFSVWHPAVTKDSDMAHPIVFQDEAMRGREVNFIDLQAVAFDRGALARWLPEFYPAGMFSWGFIACWAARERLGIVDEAPMLHPKRTSANPSTAYRGAGSREQGAEEKIAFERAHGLPGTMDIRYEIRRRFPR